MSIQINELHPVSLLVELDSTNSNKIFGGDISKLERLSPVANVVGNQVNIAEQKGLVNIAIQTNINTNINLNLRKFKP